MSFQNRIHCMDGIKLLILRTMKRYLWFNKTNGLYPSRDVFLPEFPKLGNIQKRYGNTYEARKCFYKLKEDAKVGVQVCSCQVHINNTFLS